MLVYKLNLMPLVGAFVLGGIMKRKGIAFGAGLLIIAAVLSGFGALWQAYEQHVANHHPVQIQGAT